MGRKSSGRHSAEPNTATGVLKTVKRRPMVAAIALPAAATTAIVASSFAFAPDENAGVVKAENQATAPPAEAPEETPAVDEAAEQEHWDKAAEEYFESLKDDPNYTSEVKTEAKLPTPEPEPTPSESKSKSKERTESSSRSSDRSGETASGSSKESSDESSSGSSKESSDESSSGSSKESSDESSSGSSSEGVSNSPCSVSSSIESGLTANAKKGYRAVCAAFPEVKSYGGRRNDPGSDHHSGNAVDVMITGSTGDRITEYLIANKSELNIKYVIREQKIFASYTGWKGRPMSDRGSVTANHYDHVHISFQ
ncbi:ligand-binding protein SH3 [Brevibacterium sp. R8603A2]|uniref:ligand-binding protein SH3 n=1 Tax=Brevibacterium sp. R8603A2 TaxID=2929779 RepID=UPI001FFB4F5B|nr:ligand-binding protein SH3 [Brevibacterium sp. R8603A2]MCK1801980.1 ligand-binding protein SH3 [Brevibacterium sp. R8603A2]